MINKESDIDLILSQEPKLDLDDNSSSQTLTQPIKTKKKINKKVLWGILGGVGGAAVTAGIVCGCVYGCNSKSDAQVILDESVSKLNIKVKSFDVQSQKDSWIEFEVPADKYIKKMIIQIGNATEFTVTNNEFDRENINKLLLSSELVTGTTVTIKSAELDSIVNLYFEAVDYSPVSAEECMIKATGLTQFYKGKIKVPATLNGKKVTGLAEAAFKDCDFITEYEFENPDQITEIRSSAFIMNESLTTFTFPKNVSAIEDSLFEDCKALKTITLNDKITTIGANAFADTIIESMTIPKTVTKIGKMAFSDCTKLTSVDFVDTTKTWIQSGGSTITITDKTTNATNLVNCESGKTNNWGYTGIELSTEKTASVVQDHGVAYVYMTIDTPTIKNSEGENIIKLSNVWSEEPDDLPGHLLVSTSLEGAGDVASISFTLPGTGTGTPPASAQITISDWTKITSGSTLYVSFTTE